MNEQTMKNLARIHWEKHRPKMVAHLKAKKEYETALEHNARIASDVLSSKLSLGADLETAKKYVLKTWIFLPDEKTEPLLDADLMPFSQPGENSTGLLPPEIPGRKQNPIELIMTDGSQFQVSHRVLDVLLDSHRVLRFKRSSGWVTIGIDAVRGRPRTDDCYLYDGPEKRALY